MHDFPFADELGGDCVVGLALRAWAVHLLLGRLYPEIYAIP
jgi:hypothetical protein